MEIAGKEVTILKSDRKTVSIFIERDGSLSARVPTTISEEEMKEVLQAKEYQIFKHLAEWEQLNSKAVEREYVAGQSFLYLGRNYRLKFDEIESGKLHFRRNTFWLNPKDLINAKHLFKEFYKIKLIEKLHPLIDRFKHQLGKDPKNVRVMELQHRWASCTSDNNLNFHWKCAMAPIDVLQYIVVHELVHLIHKNHSREFWNELDKILPNYDSQKHWLKVNGAGMDL